MSNRESHRIKDAEKKRILDDTARKRRLRKAIEALEQDNFHDDPHADLVMSKKVPKFQDNLDLSRSRKSKKSKNPEYFKAKYRKSFIQLIEEDRMNRPDPPNYCSAQVDASKYPERHFCAVCGFFSTYTCTSCGTRYCSVKCLRTHFDTRCLKWTA